MRHTSSSQKSRPTVQQQLTKWWLDKSSNDEGILLLAGFLVKYQYETNVSPPAQPSLLRTRQSNDRKSISRRKHSTVSRMSIIIQPSPTRGSLIFDPVATCLFTSLPGTRIDVYLCVMPYGLCVGYNQRDRQKIVAGGFIVLVEMLPKC